MFGGRKKPHTKDQDQNQAAKKKWQEEIEDELDVEIPEDLEIPKDLSDDENNMNDEKNGQDVVENIQDEKDVEENKQKEFDWMTSEDEMNAEGEEEGDEKLTKENGDKEAIEEIVESKNEELDDDSKDARTIFISNIPLDATDEQILDKFRIFGTIMNIEVPRNEGSRLNKGRAFIEFSSIEDAQEAFEGKHYMKENLLNLTLGLNTAIKTVTTSQKELPFTYDERSRKYLKAGEIEMRKKLEEEESESGESDSSSESGSDSGSDSEDSESDDEKLIKRKKPVDESDGEEAPKKQKGRNRKDSRSRSRSQSKSPSRTKLFKKR